MPLEVRSSHDVSLWLVQRPDAPLRQGVVRVNDAGFDPTRHMPGAAIEVVEASPHGFPRGLTDLLAVVKAIATARPGAH